VGERFTHLSLLDTRFDCRIEEAATVGGEKAIVPNVSGRAWLTGVSYYGTDPEDPFPEGYRLNDTWFAC
jgi:proline racemase